MLRAALERSRRSPVRDRTHPMTPILLVSNRGPLSFRFERRHRPRGPPAAAGSSPPSDPLVTEPGSEVTWVSVTMGAADRAGGRPRPDGRRALRAPARGGGRRHLPAGLRRHRQHRRSGTAITISSICPAGPDSTVTGGWPGRASAATTGPWPTPSSTAAPPGSTVLVQDYHFSLLGRMLAEARPDLRTVHFCHIPFADPNMLRVLPDDAVAELLAGLAGFGACGFHAAAGRPGSGPASTIPRSATAAPRPPSSPRSRPITRASWPRRRRRVRPIGRDTAGRDRRAAHHPAGRPRRAVQEHRARHAGLRGAAGGPSRVARAGGARGPGLPVAPGSGRVSRLWGRGDAHGRADQPRLGHGRRGRRSCCTSTTTGPAPWPP